MLQGNHAYRLVGTTSSESVIARTPIPRVRRYSYQVTTQPTDHRDQSLDQSNHRVYALLVDCTHLFRSKLCNASHHVASIT